MNYKNSIYKYFNLKLDEINQLTIWIIYLFFISAIVVASCIFCNLYAERFNYIVDENFNLNLKYISFHHGSLIYNLFYNGIFQQEYLGVNFVLLKMPLLPLLICSLAKISTNFYFIIITKNILLFSFLFFIIFISLKSLKKELKYFIIFLFLILYNPYNLFTSLNFEYEDFLISILLPSAFCLLVSKLENRYIYLSFIFFFLYLSKTSMFFLTCTLPLLIIFYENSEKQKIKKFLPLLGIIFAILIWGGFGYNKTGKFPFGSTLASINSNALSVAFNKEFHKYYPNKSVDLIKDQYKVPKNLKNEWDFYDYFKEKNKEYLKNNKERIIKDGFIKLKFILFHIHRDGAQPDAKGKYDNSIRFSNIPNKVFINLSLLISFLISLSKIKNIFRLKDEFYFLSIFGLNIFTHLVAWATSKHLVAISIICSFYLILKIKDITYFFFAAKSDNINSQN